MDFIFVFDVEYHGTFQSEHCDMGCSFVLTKGPRIGQLCGKLITYSRVLDDVIIPACSAHRRHYEDLILEDIDLGFQPPIEEEVVNVRTTIKLENIPKAIERSTECIVCYEHVNPLLMPCGHTTCFSCTCMLQKDECPLCRAEFKHDQLKRL